MRLYLPEDWAKDRARRAEAGIPKTIKFQTRHQLALEMLEECGGELPHTWVAGDDEMGRPSSFRLNLRSRGERYLLAVPSNTLIRDIDVPPPEYSGRGRHPKSPFMRVDDWCSMLPEGRVDQDRCAGRGERTTGDRSGEVSCPGPTDTGGTGPDEILFVTRERQADATYKHDYYFSNATDDVPLAEFARVAKAAHRIEECFERAKGEAGLADYQVRNWIPWYHHQALSLLAAWFLNKEMRRGKKKDAGADAAATTTVDRRANRYSLEDKTARLPLSPQYRWLQRNEQARFYFHRSQHTAAFKEPAQNLTLQ